MTKKPRLDNELVHLSPSGLKGSLKTKIINLHKQAKDFPYQSRDSESHHGVRETTPAKHNKVGGM